MSQIESEMFFGTPRCAKQQPGNAVSQRARICCVILARTGIERIFLLDFLLLCTQGNFVYIWPSFRPRAMPRGPVDGARVAVPLFRDCACTHRLTLNRLPYAAASASPSISQVLERGQGIGSSPIGRAAKSLTRVGYFPPIERRHAVGQDGARDRTSELDRRSVPHRPA